MSMTAEGNSNARPIPSTRIFVLGFVLSLCATAIVAVA